MTRCITTPCHQSHYVREELAIMLLAAISTNVKEDQDIATVLALTGLMLVRKKPMEKLTIAAFQYSKKLRPGAVKGWSSRAQI